MMNGRFKPRVPGERGVWEQFTLEDGLPDLKLECLFADDGYPLSTYHCCDANEECNSDFQLMKEKYETL